jgi:hypothetical protein
LKGAAPSDEGSFTIEQGEGADQNLSQKARCYNPSRSDEQTKVAYNFDKDMQGTGAEMPSATSTSSPPPTDPSKKGITHWLQSTPRSAFKVGITAHGAVAVQFDIF